MSTPAIEEKPLLSLNTFTQIMGVGNSWGNLFRVSTFGESHGKAIGGVIDGCPAGIVVDFDALQKELDRRKPGQSSITTQRKESDTVEFLSGFFEGKTTGTPIGFVIPNADQNSKDYDHLKDIYRPSHADFTYDKKYGIRDHRGGGRSSARETACRVVAGALAKQILRLEHIEVNAFVSGVGKETLKVHYTELDFSQTDHNLVRCPHESTAKRFQKLIEKTRDAGDTVGGTVTGVIRGLPAGLGEPVFDKFHARLGSAMLGINAVKGFDYGSGFDAPAMYGSDHNDVFEEHSEGRIVAKTNNSGGVQGGITTGADVFFRVAFKPVATLMKNQKSAGKSGGEITIEGKGRHDPCVVPRAVPIVEAMAALTALDMLLMSKTNKL